MGNAMTLCRTCGCDLAAGDVSQVALYYRRDRTTRVTARFVCPRCGNACWEAFAEDDWQTHSEMALEWEPTEDRPQLVQRTAAAGCEQLVLAVTAYDLGAAISLDEYIDFCRWLMASGAGELPTSETQ